MPGNKDSQLVLLWKPSLCIQHQQIHRNPSGSLCALCKCGYCGRFLNTIYSRSTPQWIQCENPNQSQQDILEESIDTLSSTSPLLCLCKFMKFTFIKGKKSELVLDFVTHHSCWSCYMSSCTDCLKITQIFHYFAGTLMHNAISRFCFFFRNLIWRHRKDMLSHLTQLVCSKWTRFNFHH